MAYTVKEQKIKQQDANIGVNIRRIRLQQHLKQTELVRMLQLNNVDITREQLVKIERGTQHISVRQLRGIRNCLKTTDEVLLGEDD